MQKNMRNKHKVIIFLPLSLLLAIFMAACGYATPEGGGGLTPYVVVVTPTVSNDQLTARAVATFQALPTATPTTAPPKTSAPPAANTPVPAPKATPTLAITGDTYTVQPGDTLLGIAIRLKVDMDDLIALNKIADPDNLLVGQKLKIPPKQANPAPTPTKGS
jgi:LysM repeat protein